jgi:hypothetical protein
MDHVVVGALELTLQSPPKCVDLDTQLVIWHGHTQYSRCRLALDVCLIAMANDENIDRVVGGQRPQHMTQLNTGAIGRGETGEGCYQDAWHRA